LGGGVIKAIVGAVYDTDLLPRYSERHKKSSIGKMEKIGLPPQPSRGRERVTNFVQGGRETLIGHWENCCQQEEKH